MPHVNIVSNLGSPLPKRAASSSRRALRVSTLARRQNLDPRQRPIVCQLNGKTVFQRDWRKTVARGDDVVTFLVLPRGAGTFRTVASLAILIVAAIVAPYIAVPLAGALGFGATSAVGIGLTAATTATLAIGGDYQLDASLSGK